METTRSTRSLPESAGALLPSLFGHAAFQQLNAACRLGLLDHLHTSPGSDRAAVGAATGLGERAVDTLVLGATALGLVVEDAEHGLSLGPPVQDLFDCGSWEAFRALVEFESEIVYLSHTEYIDSLRDDTNAGLAWFPGDGENLYQRLAADPRLNELFFRAMHAWSELTHRVLLEEPALENARHLLDVGGGDAVNAIAVAGRHPHLQITVLDTPDAVAIAERNVADAGLADRVRCVPGDMFDAEYPDGVDAVLLANQVSIWPETSNRELVARAHAALPPGGTLLVFNQFVFGDGPTRLYAALDAVYFATLPTGCSRLWPVDACLEWISDAGFSSSSWSTAAWTPHATVVARK